MKRKLFQRKKVMVLRTVITLVVSVHLGPTQNITYGQNGPWVAPPIADNKRNPYQDNEEAMKDGKKLFNQLCAICHGAKGKGDGVAGMSLNPRPADLTKAVVQSQTDGAIFWKMTEGRAPMAEYKSSLSEEQRWQLVNYIRSLAK